jgi:DNA-binding transcriptional ArsR family regulator
MAKELSSETIELIAQRFRAMGEPMRLRILMALRDGERSVTELVELQEIEALLPAEGRSPGEVVPVHLHARVTDIGTLELSAVPVGGNARWKVEFDVRAPATA